MKRSNIWLPERMHGLSDDLLPYPLTSRTVHLCVDMQRIFSTEGPWATPWMERVLPLVTEIAERYPERTVFTRFITPNRADDSRGCGNATTRAGS
jgi:nicotinamidase-related amidase